MQISGHCHCGNISFALTWEPTSVEIPARACSCSFCTAHACIWTSCPAGTLKLTVRDPACVTLHAFATRTAQFHICDSCGDVPVATSRIDGRLYAVVNVNAFDGVAPSLLRYASVEFDGESADARIARRRRNWIANVEYLESTA